MPCIICKKERSSFLRIPLGILSEAKEQYFRRNYFCNHEFDHVCRFCSVKDFFSSTVVNGGAWFLDLFVRGGLVLVGVILAHGVCTRYALAGTTLKVLPVVAGLAVGGVLGFQFLRWFAFVCVGLGVVASLVIAGAYSEVVSPIPDIKAIAQRQQIREHGHTQWTEVDSQGRVISTTSDFDPIEASRKKSEEKRQKRIQAFTRWMRQNSPVVIDFSDEKQSRRIAESGALTLGIYYLLLFVLGAVLPKKKIQVEGRKRNSA